jgi:hypothetical protein
MAKFALRGVNFSCSLIIIAMLATTFSVFNATRALPQRGNFTAWPDNATAWPQILVLSMACVSLLATIIVFASYFRGGHRRAEKVATYYTLFAIGWFIVNMLLWAITAALYQHSRDSSGSESWLALCTFMEPPLTALVQTETSGDGPASRTSAPTPTKTWSPSRSCAA